MSRKPRVGDIADSETAATTTLAWKPNLERRLLERKLITESIIQMLWACNSHPCYVFLEGWLQNRPTYISLRIPMKLSECDANTRVNE